VFDTKLIVVLDPGHGGHDPGAVDPIEPWEGDMLHTREDEMAYDISLRTKQALEDVGYFARLTRSPGQFISLAGRCDVARELRAAAFVSVHINASENTKANGIETFSYPGAKKGARLRNAVHQEVMRFAPEFRDRGVKEARHYVTHNTPMAACLVECGFCTNPDDERRLHNPEVHERIARGIAQGVILFLKGGE
jgi:N-acetylmuramoyl-L-alanine amidase